MVNADMSSISTECKNALQKDKENTGTDLFSHRQNCQ